MPQHVQTGTAAPATAPTDVGTHFIDTTNKVPYVAVGTSAASDWKQASAGFVPVGAVLPWLKSLTGAPALPAQFLECNGQTVSDAASPFNGQTLPNLNGGNRFLRGNSTSGGTGGAATHTHTFGGSTDIEDGDHDVQNASGSPVSVAAFAHTHAFSGTTAAGSSLPPYMDVVWIIRIK
jgi:hypothetical protein